MLTLDVKLAIFVPTARNGRGTHRLKIKAQCVSSAAMYYVHVMFVVGLNLNLNSGHWRDTTSIGILTLDAKLAIHATVAKNGNGTLRSMARAQSVNYARKAKA